MATSSTGSRLASLSPLRLALMAQEHRANLAISEAEPIAVIGIGCRFPHAPSPVAFWQLLEGAIDAISEVPAHRWDLGALYDPDPESPGKIYTKSGGFLDDVDLFDPQFFGISPREAAHVDPQQRLTLEVSWEALEDAGIAPHSLEGTATGVFLGIGGYDYAQIALRDGERGRIDAYSGTGVTLSVAAGRVSYVLGLQGPTLAVDTACSSSLVSVHLACQSLRRGECETALAGGVNLVLAPEPMIAFCRARMLSPDGRCKTFDAAANGYSRGEGCGIVVLRRLADAVAAGDRVLAVIRGSAVNHDGRSAGLTVPNGPAQEAVIRRALEGGAVTPAQVGYIEAHGTGTALGDPIEAGALAAVFGARGTRPPLWVGSTKTNLGHLEAAAGIAGLIKVVLSLQHKQIPAHLHFKTPNPHIPWQSVPIEIPTRCLSWEPIDGRRIAGISSFGFSGTNAHVVVEQAPPAGSHPTGPERPLHMLCLSAKSDAALQALAQRYAGYLSTSTDPIADICHTAAVGRSHFAHRLAVVGDNARTLRDRVQAASAAAGPLVRRHATPNIAFLFTGQGAQYVDMGRELFETQPVFRRAVQACDSALRDEFDVPLLSALYPESTDRPSIDQTMYAQPALFGIEYGLAELWKSWGIEPSFVMGHSIGEYVAAAVAGACTAEDAIRLVALRGRLMQALPAGGAMAAVSASSDKVAEVLASRAGDVVIAAINTPIDTTIAGPADAVGAVCDQLKAHGIATARLNVSHAFHSPLMDPILERFEDAASNIQWMPPRLPLITNLTGESLRGTPDAVHWRCHLREPVQFSRGLQTMAAEPVDAFIEIGPNPVLLAFARRTLPNVAGLWLPSLRKGKGDWEQLLDSVRLLYVNAIDLDWAGFDRDYKRARVSAPTYPFQRERHWFDIADRERRDDRPLARAHGTAPGDHPLLGQRLRSPRLIEVVFESRLDSRECSYLSDHRVAGATVLPASAYLEMAASAALISAGSFAVLNQVELLEPLLLPPDHNRVLQVILTKDDDDRGSIEIVSRSDRQDEDSSWRRHVSATWLGARDLDAGSLPDDLCREEFARSPGDLYEELKRRGLEYGKCFQAIEALWSRELEAVARVALPGATATSPAYLIHPVVLDACFQVVAAVGSADGMGGRMHTYMPVAVKSFQVAERVAGPVWVHAIVQAKSGTSVEHVTADLRVYDDRRRLIALVEGLEIKQVDRDRLAISAQADPVADWLFRVDWQPAALRSDSVSDQSVGPWLILGDHKGTGDTIAQELRRRGGSPVLVTARDYSEILQAHLKSNGELRGIVHTCSVDAVAGEDTPHWDAVSRWSALRDVLHLVKTLSALKPARWPQLCFVTERVYAPTSDDYPGGVFQAPMWGFVRTLAFEHPEFRPRIFDLDPSTQDHVPALVSEMLGADGEDEIAFREGSRVTRRLARLPRNAGAARDQVPVRSDSTYLITGGTGALGLALAEWLVERGARHLVLVGRRSPSGAVQDVAVTLQRSGATIVFEQADVARRADLTGVFEGIRRRMPPLRGVVHAAGVLHDALLVRMTPEELIEALQPKIQGGWHLHLMTRDLPLDFFVMFSSIAALFGSPGQGNYAAANAFLDALACHRAAVGLPAISINWGPWTGAGMAASMKPPEGIGLIHKTDGLHAFELALSSGLPNVVVAPFVRGARFNERFAKVPLLRNLVAEFAADRPTRGTRARAARAVRASWRAAAPSDRDQVLGTYLREEIGAILRLQADRIDEHAPLTMLGLDSLTGLELRDRIAADLAVTVPLATFVEAPSVRDLVTFLINELAADEESAASAVAEESVGSGLLARIDDLSDQEVDSLLAKLTSDSPNRSNWRAPS